jgi:hypothetical protein
MGFSCRTIRSESMTPPILDNIQSANGTENNQHYRETNHHNNLRFFIRLVLPIESD